jgi:hypothetical protein
MIRGKLTLAENRCRFLESKSTSHESKISRLEAQVNSMETQCRRSDTEQRALRVQCDRLERALVGCQEKALRCMQNVGNMSPTQIKGVLEDLLESTTQFHSGGAQQA